jgi:hypothetical protein
LWHSVLGSDILAGVERNNRIIAMTSSDRAAQARLNGALSRGPVTPEGKARAALNATRHGLAGTRFALLPHEDPEEFQAVADTVMADLAPRDMLEEAEAREAVHGLWRRRRADRLEARIVGAMLEEKEDGPLLPAMESVRALGTLLRYIGRIQQGLDRALARLSALQTRSLARPPAEAPRAPPQPAAEASPTPPSAADPRRPNEPGEAPASAAAVPLNRQQRRRLERQTLKVERREQRAA